MSQYSTGSQNTSAEEKGHMQNSVRFVTHTLSSELVLPQLYIIFNVGYSAVYVFQDKLLML